jgi:hypothetical protein
MKKWALSLAIIFGLALSSYLAFDSSSISQSKSAQKLKKNLFEIISNNSMNRPSDDSPSTSTFTGINDQFKKWFDLESESIENSTPNPDYKEAELRQKAASLSSSEIDLLSRATLETNSPARKKIFAVYLLSLAPEKTAAGLFAIVQSPYQFNDQNPTHSPEETLAMQEKTLRKMALESLLQRAAADPGFRETFRKSITQISESSLRNYAEQVLANMK